MRIIRMWRFESQRVRRQKSVQQLCLAPQKPAQPSERPAHAAAVRQRSLVIWRNCLNVQAELEEREERRKMQELRDQERWKEEEKERLQEQKREEELQRSREEQEQKEEEEEEYLRLRRSSANRSLAACCRSSSSTSSFQKSKVVLLEDLASRFSMRSQDAIGRLQDLMEDGSLTGVMDDRGKCIFITPEELNAVAQFIKKRGRVSISELVQASNTLINLTPELQSSA